MSHIPSGGTDSDRNETVQLKVILLSNTAGPLAIHKNPPLTAGEIKLQRKQIE